MTGGPEARSRTGETAAPDGIVTRVLGWLRAGYPEGVPQQDYVALLGILQRSLTAVELDRVVVELTAEAEARMQLMTPQLVHRRITDVVKGPVRHDDLVRVSARLAAAGWPLGSPLPDDDFLDGDRPGLVTRVVDWLRAGYPAGLPDRDFVPVIALLRRRLTDDEVREVAAQLVEDGVLPAPDPVDIGAAVAAVTTELPSTDDVERVRAYLLEHAGPEDFAA